MVDVAVQGLVHCEHELRHTDCLSLRDPSARFELQGDLPAGLKPDAEKRGNPFESNLFLQEVRFWAIPSVCREEGQRFGSTTAVVMVRYARRHEGEHSDKASN